MRHNPTPATRHTLRNRIFFVGCAASVVACLFIIANARGGERTASLVKVEGDNSFDNQATTGPDAQGEDEQDYATYRHLFSHVYYLKKKGEAADAKGENGNKLRHLYKNAAGLSDDQASILESIALDCEGEIAKIDEQALKLVNAFRNKVQNLRPTENPPNPPHKLKVLQEMKKRAVLSARDRLRAAFGAEGIGRFEQFLKQEAGIVIERRPAAGPKL